MQNSNTDYAVFYATFARSTASAWLLENISLDEKLEDVRITSTYIPKSQLDFTVHNKNKKILRCVIPEWLWSAKMIEADKWNPKSESEFDQFEKLFATKGE